MIKQIVSLAIFVFALLNPMSLPWSAQIILLLISYDAMNFFGKLLLAGMAYYFGISSILIALTVLFVFDLIISLVSLGIFKPIIKAAIVFFVALISFPFQTALFAAIGSLLLNSILK